MKKILIVDDHADIRRLIRLTLEFEDYDIREAANGEAALELAAQIQPDLVLLDVMMPGPVNGLEVCRRLRGQAGEGPRIIMLSARGQASDVGLKISRGQDAFCDQPKGHICTQDPKANASIDKGQTITVAVSKGSMPVALPDETGKSLNDAKQDLSAKGFTDIVTKADDGSSGKPVNTVLRGVTLYDNLAANSYANFAGVTLAATDGGIVALVGDNDLGAEIKARVKGGVSDLGDRSFKQVLAAYVGYRASGTLDLTVIVDQHHEYVYALDPMQDGDDLHASRVKLGRGLRGRYWQWVIENSYGCAFDVDGITMQVQPLKRGV